MQQLSLIQMLNLILFWLFCGLLCSYLAKRQGKGQLLWFGIGLFMGVFGIALVLGLPFIERYLRRRAPAKRAPPLPPKISISRYEFWHYLDGSHSTRGPLDFHDLAKAWRSESITLESYVWSEGMEGWKKVSELPDLLKDLQLSS